MKIGVALVTFNRKNELQKALVSYEEQIKKPEYIIVVNNNSTDGTEVFLEKWENEKSNIQKIVINLERNIGGSGGFYTALKKAIELDADWIWVADDDAYPDKLALKNIENFYFDKEEMISKNRIAAMCATVINNNMIDLQHRKRIKKGILKLSEREVDIKEYSKDFFELDLFSYVGTVINKKALIDVGLTEKEYFIYYDDTEHSIRLSKWGKILCLPNVRVIHDIFLQERDHINWKLYYGFRNRIISYKKHFSIKYYYYEYVRYLTKAVIGKIINKNDKYNDLLIAVLKDSKNDKTGIHNIYKPGWVYSK